MSKKYRYAVFIGRMQPPHQAHIDQIKRGLDLADNVIVVLGSERCARRPKNPWTALERESILRKCFSYDEQCRIHITSVRDYYYNDNAWFTDLYNKVDTVLSDNRIPDDAKGCLLGVNKDRSSWYLNVAAQRWTPEFSGIYAELVHATDIRNALFEGRELPDFVPEQVKQWLESCFVDSQEFKDLQDYYLHCKQYKQDYSFAGAKQHNPIFVTTDAVVVKNAHVLVIRRKFNPGKGNLALPGGHLADGISIKDSMLKELKEETRIKLRGGFDELESAIVDSHVFDHPDRSERGRTISHGFLVKLKDSGDLPRVKGSDDANKAFWIPIADVWKYEDEFFEDHAHIIEYFTRRL